MKGKNLFLSAVLTLALIMIACSSVNPIRAYAGSKEDTDSIAGYYKIVRLTQEGEDLTSELDELAAYGSGVYLILFDDGTGELNYVGETTQLIWDDKNITAYDAAGESEPISYTISDGNLIIADLDNEMEFTRMTEEEIEAYCNDEIGDSIDDVFTDEEKTVELDETSLPDFSESMHEDAGYYKIIAFTDDEDSYTAEDLEKAGVEFDMMLCPDGTGYTTLMENIYDVSWEDGTVYIGTYLGPEKSDYSISDYDGKEALIISDDDTVMVFEYVGEADPTYEWTGTTGEAY